MTCKHVLNIDVPAQMYVDPFSGNAEEIAEEFIYCIKCGKDFSGGFTEKGDIDWLDHGQNEKPRDF